jgi:hypothetical protein
MFALLIVAALHTSGINIEVGDLSAQLGYVDGTTETDRIRGHLRFAHDVLAAADTSGLTPALRGARAKNLERLATYARAGQFPRNDDHPDALRPTFVDARGEICAVGALFASDAGYPAAKRIADAGFKYAFIAELDDPQLLAWQQTSGLTRDELALIQPSYDGPPSTSERMWLPWGLSDRAQFGTTRVSIASEISTRDAYDSSLVTLYAQTTLPGARSTSFYVTMPMGVRFEATDDIVAAGGIIDGEPRRWFGNADLGLYFGDERWSGQSLIFRVGALLPTATEHGEAPPGMRAGDVVMELPRSYGLRLAVSKVSSWFAIMTGPMRFATRIDAGVDYARSTIDDESTIIPRAALGLLMTRDRGRATLSLDTAVAHVFDTLTGDNGFRWSTGTTLRFADRRGRASAFQPALTLAAVRTPDAWSGVVSLELGAGFTTRPPEYYD